MALITCKPCGHEIAKSAKTCPNCGAAKTSAAASISTLIYFLLVAAFIFWIWGVLTPDAEAMDKPVAQVSVNWYEGGTLAKGSGLDWQQATTANKLATCADLLAVVWQNKKLSPEIMKTLRDVDDFKPWAVLLTAELDSAFEADPDPEQNKKMFSNQDVASTAVMVMAMSGWLAL
ncbi:zinc ribbon domain-containing protein [Halopseudomonas bauzanensis]|uniref:zinc ribbon domain-containing protein n=1 Tax=Halopseudomonas bauzanensis TaxID=653930 RepID=UPI00352312F5